MKYIATLIFLLAFAGYDHEHVWGTGRTVANTRRRSSPMRCVIFGRIGPHRLKRAADSQNVLMKQTIDPDSSWELVGDAGDGCDHRAVNPQGEVFFHDIRANRSREVSVNDAAMIPADMKPSKLPRWGAG